MAQAFDGWRCVPATAAHFLHILVELIGKGCHGQACSDVICGIKTDTHVLVHSIRGEAELKFVGDHGLVVFWHLPAVGGALHNHLDYRRAVRSDFFAKSRASDKP